MKKSCICLLKITTLCLVGMYMSVTEVQAGSRPKEIAAFKVNPKGEKKLYAVTVHLSEDGEMLRVRADNVQEAEIMLCTISGMGVPCEIVLKSKTEAIIWPLYALTSGEYIVKIRNRADEKRFKVSVKKVERMF
ncbi:MAG: hypothetical protein QG594_388 [Bacteroidota bacterium]|nr:hypothetical protein [Bacteroidota bacterium]